MDKKLNFLLYHYYFYFLVLGCMYGGTSHCMENGENTLSSRGQLKGHGNWVAQISCDEENKPPFGNIERTGYLFGLQEKAMQTIDTRKTYEVISLDDLTSARKKELQQKMREARQRIAEKQHKGR